jgi:hypothetical protein
VKLLIEKISSQKVLRFRELTKDLVKHKLDDVNFIWRNKKGVWILYQDEQDLKNGKIWINYSEVWSFFEIEFNMNYQKIQRFTKQRLWLDKKIRVNTTSINKSVKFIETKAVVR